LFGLFCFYKFIYPDRQLCTVVDKIPPPVEDNLPVFVFCLPRKLIDNDPVFTVVLPIESQPCRKQKANSRYTENPVRQLSLAFQFRHYRFSLTTDYTDLRCTQNARRNTIIDAGAEKKRDTGHLTLPEGLQQPTKDARADAPLCAEPLRDVTRHQTHYVMFLR
jgi:hypothetical protein